MQCDLASADDRQSLFTNFHEENLLFNGLINVVGQEIEGTFLTRS